MRILVTGGTGFIGSHIARRLLREGHDVVITGHDAEQRIPELRQHILHPTLIGISWKTLGTFDAVFHEAAINNTTFLNRPEMFRANVDASVALFEHCLGTGCKHIVYASSTAVYGDVPAPYREDGPVHPLNPYAESKYALDLFAMDVAKRHSDVSIVGLRYCNVYGPGEGHKNARASMVYQLAKQMIKGNPRLFRDGEQKRDYVYVEDVAEMNVRALSLSQSGIFNCGSGSATTFNELVRLLNAFLKTDRTIEYIDNPYAAAYQAYTECDMTHVQDVFQWRPSTTIEAGIQAYGAAGAFTL